MPTKIEWTDETWNPVRARLLADPARVGWHCEHASAGCVFCYAERMNKRGIGTGLPYKPGHRKDIDIFLDEKVLERPLHWKRPRIIFPGSMTDLCADFVTDLMLDKIMAVAAATERHTYQFLTKRPERMLEYAGRAMGCGEHWLAHVERSHAPMWPLPNVWLGTSVEDERVRGRIDVLRQVPAAVRFLSIEPLIGRLSNLDLTGIHWVIVGGESGPGARPMSVDWVREIRDACEAQGVAFFFKQWGDWTHEATAMKDAWPGRWHEFPREDSHLSAPVGCIRVGKKTAGRMLDGRTHDAMPPPRVGAAW